KERNKNEEMTKELEDKEEEIEELLEEIERMKKKKEEKERESKQNRAKKNKKEVNNDIRNNPPNNAKPVRDDKGTNVEEKEDDKVNDSDNNNDVTNNSTNNDVHSTTTNRYAELLEVEATFYTAMCDTGCTGTTATGLNVKDTIYTDEGNRIIAVDPSVIPLGSKVKIIFEDGTTF